MTTAMIRDYETMSPHELEAAKKKAEDHVGGGGTATWALYQMLLVLLQHEADKEAERRSHQS